MGFSIYKPFAWIITVIGLVLLTLFLLAMGRMPEHTLTMVPTPVATLLPLPTAVTPLPATTNAGEGTLTGVVIAADGPVAGATVRVHLQPEGTTTAADGSFTLAAISYPVTVTVWADGYYINWQRVEEYSENAIHLTLNPVYTTDNVHYDWFEEDGLEGSAACGKCHTAYPEWQRDAHSQTATSYRFVTMYAGTNLQGKASPVTRYTDDGQFAPPDLSQPYYGPGYKLDNPNRAGNCAACHTPVAAKLETTDGCSWSGCHTSGTTEYSDQIAGSASPLYPYGDAEDGISCEFCHKIADVRLNPATGLPYDDAPGILSLELRRPEANHDVFYGPLDDIVRTDIEIPRDSYLPLQQESAFCAGCHYGVMGGVVADMRVTGGVLVYSSYAEWLASPYSDPVTGQSCQDCHMRATAEVGYFVYPEHGGQIRDHYAVSNHQMGGTNDLALLQNAVTLTGTASVVGDQLQVQVAITNDKTGHSVPTDTPLRHLLLVVQAVDEAGQPLRLQGGTTLPAWAGLYADQPGQYFAKLLRDKWTGEMPTAAYWRDIELVEDTRIQALATVESSYQFALAEQPATVTIRLLYRRAYQQIIDWKEWPDTDIVMAEQQLQITPAVKE